MKKIAAFLFILGFISLGAALAWFMHPLQRGSNPATGASTTNPSANASPTPVPSPTAATHAAPSAPKSFTPSENEKTIDSSTGKPVVKDSAEEKAIIERSLKK